MVDGRLCGGDGVGCGVGYGIVDAGESILAAAELLLASNLLLSLLLSPSGSGEGTVVSCGDLDLVNGDNVFNIADLTTSAALGVSYLSL